MTDRYVDTVVARFRYAMIGSGTPVLLLPGSGGWRLTFQTMAEALAERHTVVALDPPGQGLTEVLDPDFGYDADAIARSIAVFLDAVGLERTAIVGHSWSGGFASRFAQLYPERVTRLALLGPAGLDVKDVWEFRLLRVPILGELAVRLQSTAAVRHLLRKSFVHRERIPDPLVVQVLREMRSRPNRLARLRDMLRVERSVSWGRPRQTCISCGRRCCSCGETRTATSRFGLSTDSSPAAEGRTPRVVGLRPLITRRLPRADLRAAVRVSPTGHLPGQEMRPSSRARTTACVRLVASSLARMWLACFLTVSIVTKRSWAISRLCRPSAMSRRTSSSRLVSSSTRPATGMAGCCARVEAFIACWIRAT